jgi:hypothetical protein
MFTSVKYERCASTFAGFSSPSCRILDDFKYIARKFRDIYNDVWKGEEETTARSKIFRVLLFFWGKRWAKSI